MKNQNKDKVTADVQSLFPPDKLKYHNRFVSFLLGQPVDIDPAIQEKYKSKLALIIKTST